MIRELVELGRGLFEAMKNPFTWVIAIGGAIAIYLSRQMVSTGTKLGTPQANYVITLIQLIALILPALAIMLDVTVKYADQPVFKLSGPCLDARNWAAQRLSI